MWSSGHSQHTRTCETVQWLEEFQVRLRVLDKNSRASSLFKTQALDHSLNIYSRVEYTLLTCGLIKASRLLERNSRVNATLPLSDTVDSYPCMFILINKLHILTLPIIGVFHGLLASLVIHQPSLDYLLNDNNF